MVSHASVRALLALLVLPHFVSAGPVTLDFESFPDSTVLTTQVPGLTFSNAIILSAGITLNEFEFPPHSGMTVVSDNGGPLRVTFSSPVASFGGFFTYLLPLTLQAFDAGGHQVASITSAFSNNLACLVGPPCSGDPGSTPNEWISLAFTPGISRIMITGDPSGSSFTLDDAAYATAGTAPVPESGSISFVAVGLIFLTWVVRSTIHKPMLTTHRTLLACLVAAVLIGLGGFWLYARPVPESPAAPSQSQPPAPTDTANKWLTQQQSSTLQPPASSLAAVPTVAAQQPNAAAAPALMGRPSFLPTAVDVNTASAVTITVPIADPSLIPGSVNLLRLSPVGSSTVIAQFHDDGQNGDVVASDNIYTARVTLNESRPETIQLQVSAAFKGVLRREVSPIMTVAVTADGVAPLPPDPGPAGMTTLEGVDSDGDWVRDDVQRYIALTYPTSTKTRLALMQMAQAMQSEVLDAADRSLVVLDTFAWSYAADCLSSITAANELDMSGLGKAADTADALKVKILNTALRIQAYYKANAQLGAVTYSRPSFAGLSARCAFSTISLSN